MKDSYQWKENSFYQQKSRCGSVVGKKRGLFAMGEKKSWPKPTFS